MGRQRSSELKAQYLQYLTFHLPYFGLGVRVIGYGDEVPYGWRMPLLIL